MDHSNNATLSRLTTRAIAFTCVGLNATALGAYLASYFRWNLPLDNIVRINAIMDSTWIYLLIGFAGTMLVAMLLAKVGMRLLDIERWIQRIVVGLLMFGGALFISTAVLYPRHDLKFDSQNMKVDDDQWTAISAPVAESVLRQNVRQDASNFVFLMNICTAMLMSKLFAASKSTGTHTSIVSV